MDSEKRSGFVCDKVGPLYVFKGSLNLTGIQCLTGVCHCCDGRLVDVSDEVSCSYCPELAASSFHFAQTKMTKTEEPELQRKQLPPQPTQRSAAKGEERVMNPMRSKTMIGSEPSWVWKPPGPHYRTLNPGCFLARLDEGVALSRIRCFELRFA
jgi:hypothetical protein